MRIKNSLKITSWLVYEALLIVFYNTASFYLSLQIFELTKSPLILAGSVIAAIAPTIYLSFIAGRIIDKLGSRKVLLYSHLGLAILYIMANYLLSNEDFYLYSIFGFIILRSALSSFHSLAIMTAIPKIVPQERIQFAYSLDGFLNNGAQIIGPIVAAILYNYISLTPLMFLSVVATFLGFIWCLIILPKENITKQISRTTMQFTQYIKIIMKQPDLRNTLVFFSVFNGINGIAAAFVSAYILILASNPSESLAFYSTIIAIATLIGSLAASHKFKYSPYLVIGLTAIFCGLIGRIGITFSSSIIVISLLVGFRAMLIPISNMANQMLWLEHSNEYNRAGIFGLRRLIAQGLYPLITFAYLVISRVLNINFELDNLRQLFFVSGTLEVMVAFLLILIFRYQKYHK